MPLAQDARRQTALQSITPSSSAWALHVRRFTFTVTTEWVMHKVPPQKMHVNQERTKLGHCRRPS